LTGALLLLFLAAPSADATDLRFCSGYAKGAVKQARLALSLRRCQVETERTRWSVDYRTHFEWCRNVSLADTDRERNARAMLLRECRRR